MDDALEQELIGAGDLVLMIGSGVGYNLAGVALRLTDRFSDPTAIQRRLAGREPASVCGARGQCS
ncbi:MAG TPA: hypothetical protein VFL97_00225 [Nitrococcus sp.]|nr:hypothetical protein [Nitrococcus sp.]